MHLAHDEVHVFSVSLSDFHGELSHFQSLVSPDERERAGRFRFSMDRDHFLICRGLLRQVLAGYLAKDASAIRFSYGRCGKPEIGDAHSDLPLYFNLSHSGDLALYAVTSAGPVGVDVEQIRPVPEMDHITSRFFAPADAARLAALPSRERNEEFFTCWTGKEALLKATGDGIGEGLAAAAAVRGWQVERLFPAVGYVGAVAYTHGAARPSLWSVHKTAPGRMASPCLT